MFRELFNGSAFVNMDNDSDKYVICLCLIFFLNRGHMSFHLSLKLEK